MARSKNSDQLGAAHPRGESTQRPSGSRAANTSRGSVHGDSCKSPQSSISSSAIQSTNGSASGADEQSGFSNPRTGASKTGPANNASRTSSDRRAANNALRASDLESTVLTSDQGPMEEVHPLGVRLQRFRRAANPSPSSRRWMLPNNNRDDHDNRAASVAPNALRQSRQDTSGSPVASSWSDEPDRRIHSRSVPPSRRSPRPEDRLVPQSSVTSFDGIEPEFFFALRNADRNERANQARK